VAKQLAISRVVLSSMELVSYASHFYAQLGFGTDKLTSPLDCLHPSVLCPTPTRTELPDRGLNWAFSQASN
jgi:hypothetical protein